MNIETQSRHPETNQSTQRPDASELERLLNELTCGDEPSPERIAEEQAAAKWRRRMFATCPSLTVPEVHKS